MVSGRTPFHLAALQVSVDVLRILLPFVRDINLAAHDGYTAVHYAACFKHPSHSQSESLDLLISYGADVRRRDNDGRTALHMVAYSDNITVAEMLIANGAELDVTENVIGETPLNTAAAHDRQEMIKLLLESGADVTIGDKNHQTPLHKLQAVQGSCSCAKGFSLWLLLCKILV